MAVKLIELSFVQAERKAELLGLKDEEVKFSSLEQPTIVNAGRRGSAAAAAAFINLAKKQAKEASDTSEGGKQKGQLLDMGVKIIDARVGAGPNVEPKKSVRVKYTGRFGTDGRVFEKNTISFKLGKGDVIKGQCEHSFPSPQVCRLVRAT